MHNQVCQSNLSCAKSSGSSHAAVVQGRVQRKQQWYSNNSRCIAVGVIAVDTIVVTGVVIAERHYVAEMLATAPSTHSCSVKLPFVS